MSRNPFLNNRFNKLDIGQNKKNKKYTHNESSKNSFSERNEIPKKVINEFIVTDELFPILNPIVVKEHKINNFKDALSYNSSQTIKENIIKEGWIEVYRVNNNIVYNNTLYDKPSENKDSNIMNKYVNIMQEKYNKYRKNYDDINGDGAYDETFLTITYESEYDTDEDEYNSDIDYEDMYDEFIDDSY